MTYTERLIREWMLESSKVTVSGYRRPSNVLRLAKLGRLIAISRSETPDSVEKLKAVFKGRLCRVPFRFNFERY